MAYNPNDQDPRPKWKAGNGMEIPIEKMDNKHLVNSIGYLQNKAVNLRKTALEYYKSALQSESTDMVDDEFIKEMNFTLGTTWRDYIPAVYWTLLEEARDRKLIIPKIKQ